MLQEFIGRFIPDEEIIRTLIIPLGLFSFFAAFLTGWMKKRMNSPTAYTRKAFHFLVFSLAGVLQITHGLKAVTLLGMIVSALVIIAVMYGKKIWFYKALARETDAPFEKRFIIIPLAATIAGGILSNLFFPFTAHIGYFIGGWGDAIGEPVGTKWGKHRYTVPTLFGVRATRSFEGSAAVIIVSSVVAVYLIMNMSSVSLPAAIIFGCITGIMAGLVEAISSHGLDNLTIQLSAAGIVHGFIVCT